MMKAMGGKMAMKSKGYAKGGAKMMKAKKGKMMTVAQLRAMAKKKGMKLVKA